MVASVCSTDGRRIFPAPSCGFKNIYASSKEIAVVRHCLEVKSERKVLKLGRRQEEDMQYLRKSSFLKLTDIIRGLVDGV